jgi:hypothetical protein
MAVANALGDFVAKPGQIDAREQVLDLAQQQRDGRQMQLIHETGRSSRTTRAVTSLPSFRAAAIFRKGPTGLPSKPKSSSVGR